MFKTFKPLVLYLIIFVIATAIVASITEPRISWFFAEVGTSISMIMTGFIFANRLPAKVNMFYGYRTGFSMKNENVGTELYLRRRFADKSEMK